MMQGLGLVFQGFWNDIFHFGLWFWIPFSVVMGALVWAYRHSKPIAHWELALLAILPLTGIVVGLSEIFSRYLWITIRLGLWFWLPFSITFAATFAAFVWNYLDSKPIGHRKFALLAILPLLWVFIGIWGVYFETDYETGPHNPIWVLLPVDLGIFVYLGCSIGLVIHLRGARLFASLFALLNLYFMLVMSMAASALVRV